MSESEFERWVNETEGLQHGDPWVRKAFEAGHKIGVESQTAFELVRTQRDDEKTESARLREFATVRQEVVEILGGAIAEVLPEFRASGSPIGHAQKAARALVAEMKRLRDEADDHAASARLACDERDEAITAREAAEGAFQECQRQGLKVTEERKQARKDAARYRKVLAKLLRMFGDRQAIVMLGMQAFGVAERTIHKHCPELKEGDKT